MVNANEQILKVFAEIQKEAANDRHVSNLTNSVGHLVINGMTYEVTISLESDYDEMIVDPLSKEVVPLVI